MVNLNNLGVFIVLSLVQHISAGTCYSSIGYYSCSIGQSCGSYYGDCRGLSTYTTIAIVCLSISFFSLCLRCCIRLYCNDGPTTTVRSPVHNTGPVQVQVHSFTNNMATRSPQAVPNYGLMEAAPPSYDAAIYTPQEQPKF